MQFPHVKVDGIGTEETAATLVTLARLAMRGSAHVISARSRNIYFLDIRNRRIIEAPFSRKMGPVLRKALGTKRQEHLVALLREKREAAGLTQVDLARALSEHQSFVARMESGQRRIDVIEYLTLAEVIGFDAAEALRAIIAKTEEAKSH